MVGPTSAGVIISARASVAVIAMLVVRPMSYHHAAASQPGTAKNRFLASRSE
jgi:hypothetical protein